uniref:leucine-rich repeat domain-containing protein n=1 Tax=Alistipes putredinis TaxID=28117 RepID=UPI003FD73A25
TLGDRAFADCGLTALALPDNVTTLGDGAFSNNPNIATLQFGAGLTAISDNAFATNNAIESLTIPKTIATIGAGSFANWSKLTKLTISGNTLTSIGSKAFENAALLADVYAEPTTAPAVQADSFSGAGTSVQGSKTFHVASVEAYSSWTTAASGYTMEALGPDYLSEGLYYRASGEDPWKSEIPQTFTTLYVKTVGDNTVMTAAQMKSVADAVLALAAPATVDFSEVVYESTTFPNSFKSNANLAGIVFPQNVTATASAAFQKTGMTSVTVLKDISYGSNAFDSCASLVSVTVEEGVTEIGNYMFQNTKLTDVTLPNSVTKIGASAFNGCSLTTINFGQGVKTIENSAFQNCGELTEIILPDATETLGQNAFGDCPKLAKISLGKNMKTLEAYCFVGYSKGCPLLGDIICRATTPPTLKDDYGTGPFGGGWSPVAGKDVPAENRIIHLPKSADLVGGTGAYADSSWVKLTSSTYGFAFKYDVEG